MQREWRDDPKGQVKLLAYKPKDKEWSAVRYPLDATEEGWMGLSEITAHDGQLYIVERDNLIGEAAKAKRVYSVAIDGFKPAKLGGELPVVDEDAGARPAAGPEVGNEWLCRRQGRRLHHRCGRRRLCRDRQ